MQAGGTTSNDAVLALNGLFCAFKNTLMSLSIVKRTVPALVCVLLLFLACSKRSDDNNTGNVVNCSTSPILLTASVGPATLGQSDGTINATASGGVGAITYSIDGNTFQNTGVFANLAVGTYTITARTTNGCTASLRVNVTASNPCQGLNITVTTTTTATSGGQANGSITASATGGTAPYTYSRDGGVSFQSSATFSNLAAGNYTIIARDANGCSGSRSVTLN
jgi:hypothetical protein